MTSEKVDAMEETIRQLLSAATSAPIRGVAFSVAVAAAGATVAALILHYLVFMSGGRAGVLGKYAQWLQHQLEKVFIDWPVKKCANAIAGSIVAFGALGYWWLGIVGAVFGLLLGSVVPYAVAKHLYGRRMKLLSDQLVDAIALCSNSLKAGHSLAQAFGVIIEEMPMPVKREFELVVKQNQLGATLDEALAQMANRGPLQDYQLLANAVVTLRQTGGNLVQTFDILVSTIRERKRLEDKIKTITAESKMQGYTGAAAPWFIVGIMYLIQPDIVGKLFTEPMGWAFLGVVLTLDVVGLLLILKMAKVDV